MKQIAYGRVRRKMEGGFYGKVCQFPNYAPSNRKEKFFRVLFTTVARNVMEGGSTERHVNFLITPHRTARNF